MINHLITSEKDKPSPSQPPKTTPPHRRHIPDGPRRGNGQEKSIPRIPTKPPKR